jgi:hypothetical protein
MISNVSSMSFLHYIIINFFIYILIFSYFIFFEVSDRVYSMIPGAVAYSLVSLPFLINLVSLPGFAGTPLNNDTNNPKCAMSYSNYENGKIGFFGDVNGEDSTIESITLLGLI